MGPAVAGQTVELKMGFSLRRTDQARANLEDEMGLGRTRFDKCRSRTRKR